MTPLFFVALNLLFVGHATGALCDGAGRTCYYIGDPCPTGTEECSDQFDCSSDTNKCCCPVTSCPDDWETFNSQCYYYVDKGKMVMSQGEQECQKFGATLPVIKSAEENDFLLRLIEDHGSVWLGMEAPNGDNDFYWVDGTSVAKTFSAWNTGEPNYPGEENCGYLYASGSAKGKWNNNRCDNLYGIVCQKQK